MSAQTMITATPIGTGTVACPDDAGVSPIDYEDSTALADEIRLFDDELVAVRVLLTPLTDEVPSEIAFSAAWPSRVVDPSPTCAFVVGDSSSTLDWTLEDAGGASFTVSDFSSSDRVTIEIWLTADDPEIGAPFSTNLRAESPRISVEPLGGRVQVDRRSDAALVDVSFPPVINVWYGAAQPFGQAGRGQQWVNVLGRVTDRDGISSLTYSVNGGSEVALSLGPDQRRLAREGDFNIQIDYDDLAVGPNVIVITAVDQAASVSSTEVSVLVSGDAAPSLPTTVDFDPSRSILEQAAVVDGPWFVNTNGTVTTDALAYDRILSIGDTSWTDYEVNLTVTVHELGTDYATPQSGNFASVGLAVRWLGHTQRSTEDPYIEYFPTGALISHQWFSDEGWRMVGNQNSPSTSEASTPLLDVVYNWRAQVRTVGDGTEYRFKSWAVGTTEPSAWAMEILDEDSPPSGALALVAHHVDADFGSVSITPLP